MDQEWAELEKVEPSQIACFAGRSSRLSILTLRDILPVPVWNWENPLDHPKVSKPSGTVANAEDQDILTIPYHEFPNPLHQA